MRISSQQSQIDIKSEKKKKQKDAFLLKKKLYRNGDMFISALGSLGGAVSTLATGNPTGLFPLYAHFLSWDVPNLLSAYQRVTKNIENSRREFTDSKFFAHLSYGSTGLIGPVANKFIPEKFFNDGTVRTLSSMVGAAHGLVNILWMKDVRSRIAADKASMNFNEHIHQTISNHVNNIYLGHINKKENIKDNSVKQKLYQEIFDPKKFELAINEAKKNYTAQQQNKSKGIDLKHKKPLGLPRLNLQYLMTTAIAMGFLYSNRQGIDPKTNRNVGNPMIQVGCASRLMTAFYQMIYEPVFEKRDRSFMNDFWSLKAGHTKSDIITIAIFGLSNPIAKYITQGGNAGKKMGLHSHAVALAAAAGLGLVSNSLTPILKHYLDSNQTKANEASIILKNILTDKVDDIDNLSKLSNKEITQQLMLDPVTFKKLPKEYKDLNLN